MIATIKKSNRINYPYYNELLNNKEFHSQNRKRCDKLKYPLTPVKTICVKNKPNCKDWLAFVFAYTSFSAKENIIVYLTMHL